VITRSRLGKEELLQDVSGVNLYIKLLDFFPKRRCLVWTLGGLFFLDWYWAIGESGSKIDSDVMIRHFPLCTAPLLSQPFLYLLRHHHNREPLPYTRGIASFPKIWRRFPVSCIASGAFITRSAMEVKGINKGCPGESFGMAFRTSSTQNPAPRRCSPQSASRMAPQPVA
jgi:hypothetical protein